MPVGALTVVVERRREEGLDDSKVSSGGDKISATNLSPDAKMFMEKEIV